MATQKRTTLPDDFARRRFLFTERKLKLAEKFDFLYAKNVFQVVISIDDRYY